MLYFRVKLVIRKEKQIYLNLELLYCETFYQTYFRNLFYFVGRYFRYNIEATSNGLILNPNHDISFFELLFN